MSDPHYLKTELYARLQADPTIFNFLKEGTLDGIWFWDATRPEEEWMDPKFKRLFGYEDHEIVNDSTWWQANIHPDDLKVALENLQRHCEDPSHPYDQVVRYRHRDGSTVWVRCRGLALRDEHGNAVRILGAHNDITALKEAEQQLTHTLSELSSKNTQLEQQAQTLKATNADLEQFAYAASHDLKAPLRGVKLLLDILEENLDSTLDDESRSLMQLMVGRIDRMEAMLTALLDYARMGTASPNLQRVDISAMLSEIVTLLHPPTHLNITWGEQLPTLYTAPAALQQVLTNLIANAIAHHTGPTGQIRIDGVCIEGMWHFSVDDDGPGVPESQREAIFEVFRTLKRKDEREATGMGLSFVRKRVTAMGGRVHCEASPLGGARFVFTWPEKTPTAE
ncbi:MAG: sensor histidine kinase [Bradymonadia bacterium]